MLGVILFWLVVQLFSLAALPLAWRLFAFLPSRGYALAKALGLLSVSYFLWLGATFRLLSNTVGGILFALAIFAGISFWVGRDGLRRDGTPEAERPLLKWLRDNRWLILSVELLFLVVLAGWAAFRAFNPDISGTEKPMELAFLNGVLASRFFPPQDPWLSGYGISYYYFGYVMLGVMTRLSGVSPAVAFNLGVALWCSLAAVGAFGLVYDLVQLAVVPRQAGPGGRASSRGIRYGLLGSFFIAFLGNLEGVVELGYNRGLVPVEWIRWLDIKQLTDSPPTGNFTGGFWWWWHASRVIHDKDLLGNSVEVIDEFPFFSFLLGDMHPHVLALPFVLLSIGLGINLMLSARSCGSRPETRAPSDLEEPGRVSSARRLSRFLRDVTGLGLAGLVLYSVILGALAFLNTWDFPIYVGLTTLAVGAGLALRRGLSWGVVGRAAATGVVLSVLGWMCYVPFYVGFQTQLGGVLPNLLFPTRLSQYLLVFGTFLVVVVFYLGLLSRSWAGSERGEVELEADMAAQVPERTPSLLRRFLVLLPWVVLLPIAFWAVLGLLIAVLPQGRELVQALLNDPAVAANIGSRTVPQLVLLVLRLRAGNPWVYLVLTGLIAWALAIVWVRFPSRQRANVEDDPQGLQGASDRGRDTARAELIAVDTFALLMIGTALVLVLSVEFVYLRDMFGTRMNTVFKFYYQAWILLGLAAAYGLSRLAARPSPAVLKWTALVATTLLVAGGLFYTVAAIPSKADNFRGQPTLDGLAYLRRDNPADAAAIEWLRTHVPPSAIVLEATGGSYSPEGAGRVSMATGNPTLLGWDFHEMQWRGKAYEKLGAGRPDAITQIYRTAQPEDLPGLLDRWGIDFVYVGALERNKYKINDAGLSRFDSVLNRVYDADGVIIFVR
jgi:YYY domain-containing protein